MVKPSGKALERMQRMERAAAAAAPNLVDEVELAEIFAFFDVLRGRGVVFPQIDRLQKHLHDLQDELGRWRLRLADLSEDAVADEVAFAETAPTEDLLAHCYNAYPENSGPWVLAERLEAVVDTADRMINALSARRFRIAKLNVQGDAIDGLILAEDSPAQVIKPERSEADQLADALGKIRELEDRIAATAAPPPGSDA